MKQTIIFVLGTRPDLIKMAPLIHEAKKRADIQPVICSTGQHKEMLENLYKLFDFKPDEDFKLMKPNQSLVHLHSETMIWMHDMIEKYKPSWVVVNGDTTTAHAAAMTAFYHKIPVAQVEAGLRTYDISAPFPEEVKVLDLTVMHYFIIEKILGIAGKNQRQSSYLDFDRSFSDCLQIGRAHV